MRKIVLIICLILSLNIFQSCRPDGVLSKSEMTDVLFDVHLAESVTTPSYEPIPEKVRKGLKVEDFRDLTYLAVLKKHNISEEDFYKSIAYYSRKIRVFTKIYDDIDKRMEDYISDVNNWKFHARDIREILKSIGYDSIKNKEMYYSIAYIKDTTSSKGYSLIADSAQTFSEWKANRWLRKAAINSKTFYVIDPKDYVEIVNVRDSAAIKADSIKQVTQDAINNQAPAVVKDANVVAF